MAAAPGNTMAKKLKSMAPKRRVVQFLSLLMLHSSWGPEFKWFCTPVLSCHSCVLAWFACPIGVFIHYSGFHAFPLIALGTVLALGVAIGRLLCGWVCPFGFVQDLLFMIPSKKIHMPAWTAYIKYGVLALTVVVFPFLLSEKTWLSFCRICPASALQVTIPGLITDGVGSFSVATAVKLIMLAVILIGAIFSSRSFCKVLCPIGALLSPLNFVSFWKIKVPTQNCVSCSVCNKVCPEHGDPASRILDGVSPNRALECIVCHECQTVCPLPKPKRKKIVDVAQAPV